MSRRVLAAMAVAAALALASCSHDTTTAEERAPEVEPITVEVATVAEASVERAAPLVGAFFAFEEVTVAAQVEARIDWLGPDMGDQVEAGEVLLRLDDADIRASIREIEARLGKSRADRTRAELLRKEGIMAAGEAERMRTDVDVLESQLEMLHVKLDRTVIRAPLRGAIAERKVSLGEVVKSGDALYQLVQEDPLKFRTPIPERYAAFLRIGQPIRVRVDAFPGEMFAGEVTRINPTSDSTSRSILIEAVVPNPHHKLKPGFFATGDLVYADSAPAVAVPEKALTTFAGVTKLFVVRDGKAEERVVRTGIPVGDTQREIVDGVQVGEQVAVSNVDKLEQGLPVTAAGNAATGGATVRDTAAGG
jgi:membrane fusion protein, multidrug efflux system